MIITYDWRKIRKLPVEDILNILQDKNKLLSMKLRDSYIIDIHKLVENKLKGSESEIYVYLELASMRNFYEYKYNKNNRLKIIYIDYNIEKLGMNRLLDINRNEIIFKYEEKINGN